MDRNRRVMNHKFSLYSGDYTLTRSRSCRQRLSRFVTRSCQTTAIHAPISSVLPHQQTNPIKKTAASQVACARCVCGRLTICAEEAISAEDKQTQVISIQIFIRPQNLDYLIAVSLSGLSCACLLHT